MRRSASLAALAAGAAFAAAAWGQAEPPAAAPPGADSAAVVPTAAAAAPGRPTDPNNPWLWGDRAVLRGLDKVTAQTRDFEAVVGEDVEFFALTLSVKRCAKRPPERTPEVIVGMEVYDRQTDGEGREIEAARIFSGWMFGSSPALNPLEHPVYDVWVLDCIDSTAPVVEETPAEQAADAAAAEEPGPLPGDVFD